MDKSQAYIAMVTVSDEDAIPSQNYQKHDRGTASDGRNRPQKDEGPDAARQPDRRLPPSSCISEPRR
jgi:hypothetical protein